MAQNMFRVVIGKSEVPLDEKVAEAHGLRPMLKNKATEMEEQADEAMMAKIFAEIDEEALAKAQADKGAGNARA